MTLNLDEIEKIVAVARSHGFESTSKISVEMADNLIQAVRELAEALRWYEKLNISQHDTCAKAVLEKWGLK